MLNVTKYLPRPRTPTSATTTHYNRRHCRGTRRLRRSAHGWDYSSISAEKGRDRYLDEQWRAVFQGCTQTRYSAIQSSRIPPSGSLSRSSLRGFRPSLPRTFGARLKGALDERMLFCALPLFQLAFAFHGSTAIRVLLGPQQLNRPPR